MRQFFIHFISLIFLLFYTTASFSQNITNSGFDTISVIKKGAWLQRISNQFSFAEGPTCDKAGNIYFTDQPNDKIWLYDTCGKLIEFMLKTGHSNGLYVDKNKNLIACADEKNELWSISPNKKINLLLTGFEGHRFNGPNDVWIDKKGGIYFTDPYYQRDYWKTNPTINGQKTYYLAKGSKRAVIVEHTLIKPNGIAGTADGKYLYIADIEANKTYRFNIQKNGTLANKKLGVAKGSDGLKLDNQGNLYLCGNGISIFNNKGKKIGYIPVPSEWVGNACFGGKDKNILFITASESIYTLRMNVKGQ